MKEYINHNNCYENDIKCKATNTLAILVGILTLASYFILVIRSLLLGKTFDFWDIGRLLFISIFAFSSYFLHKKGFKVLSKFILIYSFVFFLIYYPVFFNYYSADVYTLYPIYVFLLGVFTQILFYFTKEKYYYYFVMVSLVLVLFFTDEIYSLSFAEIDLKVLWGEDYFIIKLAIIIFFTINSILFYILKKNKEAYVIIDKKT